MSKLTTNNLHANINIVSFYDLSEDWQKEALSNLDEAAYDTMYLDPDDTATPGIHILWDLSECMRAGGVHDGFTYNTAISISNNSSLLLYIDNNFETADIKFV